MDDDLLDEQRAFYRARAPKYDEWWQGRGRYQRGEDEAREWHRQVAAVEAEDGSEYRVVKVMYEPDELEGLLEAEGWWAAIDATNWFIFGSARPC